MLFFKTKIFLPFLACTYPKTMLLDCRQFSKNIAPLSQDPKPNFRHKQAVTLVGLPLILASSRVCSSFTSDLSQYCLSIQPNSAAGNLYVHGCQYSWIIRPNHQKCRQENKENKRQIQRALLNIWPNYLGILATLLMFTLASLCRDIVSEDTRLLSVQWCICIANEHMHVFHVHEIVTFHCRTFLVLFQTLPLFTCLTLCIEYIIFWIRVSPNKHSRENINCRCLFCFLNAKISINYARFQFLYKFCIAFISSRIMYQATIISWWKLYTLCKISNEFKV